MGSDVHLKEKIRTPKQAIGPATLHGNTCAVKRALRAGADPNATYQRRPILALALWTQSKPLIGALIRAGATPIPPDRAPWSWSPSLHSFYARTIAETMAIKERAELDTISEIPKSDGRRRRI